MIIGYHYLEVYSDKSLVFVNFIRPVCCKKFVETIELYWLLIIQINNDIYSI